MLRNWITCCVLVLALTAGLWAQCAACPVLKAETSEHGCCPDGGPPPKNDAQNPCNDQDRIIRSHSAPAAHLIALSAAVLPAIPELVPPATHRLAHELEPAKSPPLRAVYTTVLRI